MKRRSIILVALFALLILSSTAFGQSGPVKKGLEAITEQAVKGQLEFLASDWTEGRGTGERGVDMAADYIASMFKVYGLKPGGDWTMTRVSRAERMQGVRPKRYRTYFQKFPLVAYHAADNQELKLFAKSGGAKKSYNFNYKTDFTVSTTDVGTEFSAPVVFVGYGIKDVEKGYNEFEGLDVKGKLVLRLRGFPGHADEKSEAYKKFKPTGGRYAAYYFERNKNQVLSEMGVLGVIEVDVAGNNVRSWEVNRQWRYNTPYYEGDTPLPSPYRISMRIPGDELSGRMNTITVSKRVANELVDGTGIDFEKFEEKATKMMKPASKALTGKTVYVKTNVVSKIVQAKNVIGVIEGEDTENIIVIGGHYDHLGMINGYIYNGADDNASGTVGVMTIAKAFMASGKKPKKTIVFAAWTGEEKGLLGSNYFVDHPYKPVKNIICDLNYDMIARDAENDKEGVKLGMTYTKAYPQLEKMNKDFNEKYKMGLEINFRSAERPGGGSDHAPFAQKDIPVFYYMAAFHPDYHQVTDHVEKVNFVKMTKIIKLGFLSVWDIANMKVKF